MMSLVLSIGIVQRRIAGGGAIDISDEGTLDPSLDADRIFQRGHGVGTGIGLALARSIAEAADGRLVLGQTAPTTFSLIMRLPPE